MGDIFYLHERGLPTALTGATLTSLTALVSVIAGVLTENHRWETLFIAMLPFDVVGLPATIFLLPETQFARSTLDATYRADDSAARPTKSDTEEVSVSHIDTVRIPKAMMGY
ncbi:hypothetical protein BDW59DRAFT_165510 [Aspergillus cavernicola]|uniref:Major facilitator superfamily (MFS) profile domain-containing protein n=1 Tax=Aspergillus cavernicola TaxID=176166 RepID=A0ABR4HSG5_9EURO